MLAKKWQTEIVKLSDVTPLPENHRIINSAALRGLKASIGRFGLVELIVWNKRTKNIIGGHQRLAVLLQGGVTEAPMVVVDMSPEEEVAASLTLNNPEIEGVFDSPIDELLSQVENAEPELFKAVRMDELKASLENSMMKSSVSTDDEKQKKDSTCPCCGWEWNIDSKDIIVVKA